MKRTITAIVLSLIVFGWPRLDAQRQIPSDGSTPAQLSAARSVGLEHIRQLAALKGIPPNDLVAFGVHIDEFSMAHTRIQQRFRGVPVWGGQAIAHLNSIGVPIGETDDLLEGVSVDTTPRLTAGEANTIAANDYGCANCLTAPPTADLWVLRDEVGADHLTYRVRMERFDNIETGMPVRFIDAHSGYVVMAYDNLQKGTGTSLYSGTVTVVTHTYPGPLYLLEDRGDYYQTKSYSTSTGTHSFLTDPDDVWNDLAQRAAVDVHWAIERFYDYFILRFGRFGLDGNGGPRTAVGFDGATQMFTSLVNYNVGNHVNNASWDGSMMKYGDGDGINYSPLVTPDIVGHEMMHGITEFTAGLIYQGESGALNESWSDVFGAMLERYVRLENPNVWLIGEQAYTPGIAGDALRFMDDPHRASDSGFTADDDSDHYSERYTGMADNGGVHVNSGIANKAFYLLAAGGTHHLGGAIRGIGADDAARIWYRALTTYMTSSTNFAGARIATVMAAAELFGNGHANVRAVETAWCHVGVGSCPPADLEVISASPNTGTGTSQLFTFWYSDSLGAAKDLTAAQVRFQPTDGNPGLCVIHYRATTNEVRIQNDFGAWGAWTVFGSGRIANSYCSLDLSFGGGVPAGVILGLSLRMSFTSSFLGPKSIEMRAISDTGTRTDWLPRGTWTVEVTVEAISVDPNAGTGVSQNFTLIYRDSAGAAADLKMAGVRFGTANTANGVCTVQYNAMTGLVRIHDDAGVAGPWVPMNGGGTLSNSQCTLNLSQSSATPSDTILYLNLRLRFSATFQGTKNIYMRANSNVSRTTGWVARGTFTVAATVQAISVSPSSGTGTTQTFTLQYADSAGVSADLKAARVRFWGASGSTCVIEYNAMTDLVRIQDNLGNWKAFTPFGNGTIRNSQCTLNLAMSGAMTSPLGTEVTMYLHLTFSAGFTGSKAIDMRANSNLGSTTGWVNRGSWTVP